MTNARPIAFPALLAAVAFLPLAACETPAQRIDPAGTQTITTVGDLDIQDAQYAATQLSESLLASGVLGRDGRPSVIAISTYVNNTSRHIDRDEVIKSIRVALNKAGVAQTITTIDDTGAVGGEDAIASRHQRYRDEDAAVDSFAQGGSGEVRPPMPDYSLTFKILDNRVQAGKIKQVTYTFQMSVTDVRTGLAAWEDQIQVTKQGSRNTVGW
ncbi:MAG: hypothetical protein AAF842_05520 [Planctomycetota bacterium]